MPLLQSIVQELDTELTRLHTLRRIVADLSRTPALVRHATDAASRPAVVASSTTTNTAKSVKALAPPILSPQTPTPIRKPRKNFGTRRITKAPKAVEEPRALAKSVHIRPVVFYPGKQVQAQPIGSSAKPVQESVSFPEVNTADLDAQSRQLAARWNTGLLL